MFGFFAGLFFCIATYHTFIFFPVSVEPNTYIRMSRGWCSQTECWGSAGAGRRHTVLTSDVGCSGRRQTCSSPGRSWTQTHTAFIVPSSSWYIIIYIHILKMIESISSSEKHRIHTMFLIWFQQKDHSSLFFYIPLTQSNKGNVPNTNPKKPP